MPVRKEKREWNLVTEQEISHELYDHYIYDKKPPSGAFEMPPGKPIREGRRNHIRPEIWSSFSESEKNEIRSLIERSDSGWQKGDFTEFASAWQFGDVNGAPSEHVEHDWKTLVESQKGNWGEWSQEVTEVYQRTGAVVRTGAASFSIGIKGPLTLDVKLRLRAVLRENGRTWEGKACCYLQGEVGTRHIVYWDVPLMEILATLRK